MITLALEIRSAVHIILIIKCSGNFKVSLFHFWQSYSGGKLLVVLLDAVRPRPVEGLRLDKVDPLVRRRRVAVDAQGAADYFVDVMVKWPHQMIQHEHWKRRWNMQSFNTDILPRVACRRFLDFVVVVCGRREVEVDVGDGGVLEVAGGDHRGVLPALRRIQGWHVEVNLQMQMQNQSNLLLVCNLTQLLTSIKL